MWNEKAITRFLIFYMGCLFAATFFLIPTISSFYYYAWGKHLAWSYFDGPPMIAYFFHISNAIFGNTFFSVTVVGFLCLFVSACYLYKTGCLLLDQQTGLISVLIWLVLPTFPVIYWNAQHEWISFTYLLNFHHHSKSNISATYDFLKLVCILLLNFSVFLVLAVFGWFKYRKSKKTKNNLVLELTYVVLCVGFAFWLTAALLGGDARVIYFTPFGMNLSLIAGYYITQYQYQRFLTIIYPVFLLFSMSLILVNSWPIATYLKKGRAYSVLQKALSQADIIKSTQPIVTGYFSNAAALNFFRPDESVYAIPCGDINQYQYWGSGFLNDLAQGKIDKISYIDFRDTKQCAERFFNKCEAVATLSHHKMIPVLHKSTKPISLFVYECSSPRIQV